MKPYKIKILYHLNELQELLSNTSYEELKELKNDRDFLPSSRSVAKKLKMLNGEEVKRGKKNETEDLLKYNTNEKLINYYRDKINHGGIENYIDDPSFQALLKTILLDRSFFPELKEVEIFLSNITGIMYLPDDQEETLEGTDGGLVHRGHKKHTIK